jgi:hypothetical protein
VLVATAGTRETLVCSVIGLFRPFQSALRGETLAATGQTPWSVGILRNKIEQRLAGVEEELDRQLGAAMREAGFEPPNIHALAVSSRGLAERQILVALAKVAELSDEIERSQQESARRRPLALTGAVYGEGVVVSPEQVVRNEIDGMPDERERLLRVAAALDDELEENVRRMLDTTPPPSLELDVPDAELVEAAHRALDAQDAALVAIAAHIERRAGQE